MQRSYPMKEYNGHRSWNAWNVSLWINNDKSLYDSVRAFAIDGCDHARERGL